MKITKNSALLRAHSQPSAGVTSVSEKRSTTIEGGGVSNTPPSSYSILKTNCCIDYLKVRFDGHFHPTINAFRDLLLAYVVDPGTYSEVKGRSGYAQGYQFDENFFVFSGGTFTMSDGVETFLVEMKGSGCREFERRIRAMNWQKTPEEIDKAVHDGWRDLFETIEKYKGHCTRLDVPTDDFTGIIPFEELKSKIEGHCFSSTLRAYAIDKDPDLDHAKIDVINSKYHGWTANIGSRTNAQLCIYNKWAERVAKGYTVTIPTWIRYEVRYYHESAEDALRILTSAYEDKNPLAVSETIVGFLAGLIDIKDHPLANGNINKAPTWDKWEKFLKRARAIKVKSQQRTETTVATNALWLDHDASKALARIFAVHPEDIEAAFYYLLLKGTEGFDDTDIFKINNFLKENNKTPYSGKVEDIKARLQKKIKNVDLPPLMKKLFFENLAKLGSSSLLLKADQVLKTTKWRGRKKRKPKKGKGD